MSRVAFRRRFRAISCPAASKRTRRAHRDDELSPANSAAESTCSRSWSVMRIRKGLSRRSSSDNGFRPIRVSVATVFFSIKNHLHRYLSEFDSRFNSRRDDLGRFFDRVLGQADGRRLSLDQLVG